MTTIKRQSSITGYEITETEHTVPTERCGNLALFVQGDIRLADKRAVFMTVHDLGCNHTAFHDFVEHPAMCEIKARSIFLHVDLPGQEDHAADLPEGNYQFPSLQTFAEDLVTVLDFLHLKYVVIIGEGAGANVAARFAMAYPTRVLGAVLIHPTGAAAGFMENVRDKYINWKLGTVGMTPTAEQYLVFHRFGEAVDEKVDEAPNKAQVIADYQQRLRSAINSKNLRLFVNAFLKRTDLTHLLREKLTVETLIITGTKSSYRNNANVMFSNMDPSKSQIIQIENVGDCLNEAPEKVAQSLLLFVKGIGLLTSLTLAGVERQRTLSSGSNASDEGGNPGNRPRTVRSMSMEDYDRPNLKRLTSRDESAPQHIPEAKE